MEKEFHFLQINSRFIRQQNNKSNPAKDFASADTIQSRCNYLKFQSQLQLKFRKIKYLKSVRGISLRRFENHSSVNRLLGLRLFFV